MIDIIIVNYNATDLLLKCLKSVYQALGRMRANIFVLDNASFDGVERIPAVFPDVNLEINKENLGFARAVNKGLQKSRAPYVVLLNPDAFVDQNMLFCLYGFMRDNPSVGIVGPKILDVDGQLQNSARAFPTPLTAFFGRSSYLSRRFPKNPITSKNLLSLKSDGISPMAVDWVSGACMMVRKEAIEDVGLLDERFFMYWEDTDWCRRMWKKGWKVVYYPKAMVSHYVGGSSEKRIFRSLVEFHKSVYFLFDKHICTPCSFVKPIVFGGLMIRLLIVLISEGLAQLIKHQKERPSAPKKKPVKQIRGKIRILRIISRMNIGGPAIHVHLLTQGLNTARFHSKLVTGRISPKEGDMGYLFSEYDNKPIVIPELQRDLNLFMDISAFIRIFRILVKEKPDIVHTHTAKAGSSSRLAGFLCNLLGKRNMLLVHTFHGNVFEGYFNRLNSILFINIERILGWISHKIIAISQTQREELTRKFSIAKPEKVHIIELGFDLTPFFNCHIYKKEFRKSLGVDENTLLVGIIGRLVPIKNHHLFLLAAKEFIRQKPDIPVRFVIVGDGELRETLEETTRKMQIADYVDFAGWVREVPKVYADLDVLALTSNNEGTPVSIIESMASAVPVISTDAGGVRDILGIPEESLNDNDFVVCERGILCTKNNPEGFANGLICLVETQAEKLKKQTEKARMFVQNRYSKERLFQDMERLYLDLMKESGKLPEKNGYPCFLPENANPVNRQKN